MNRISFDGRVAIVTGGGGALGRTYALELAARGAAVVVNDLGGSVSGSGGGISAAQSVVDEIVAAGGSALACDDSVATREGGAAVVEKAMAAFGSVDVVINNAGILRDRSLAKIDFEDLEAVLAVHLLGAFHVSAPAMQVMKDRGYGRFVFTSSNAGIFGNFGQSAYGAAKSGLVGLSNVLAIEGARSGILSNVVSPMAGTRMTREVLGELADALAPEEVAPLVTFLASESCTLTHQVFSVGGGHFARVFTGLTRGWNSPGPLPASVEDVAGHLSEITDETDYRVPQSSTEEIDGLRDFLLRRSESSRRSQGFGRSEISARAESSV